MTFGHSVLIGIGDSPSEDSEDWNLEVLCNLENTALSLPHDSC